MWIISSVTIFLLIVAYNIWPVTTTNFCTGGCVMDAGTWKTRQIKMDENGNLMWNLSRNMTQESDGNILAEFVNRGLICGIPIQTFFFTNRDTDNPHEPDVITQTFVAFLNTRLNNACQTLTSKIALDQLLSELSTNTMIPCSDSDAAQYVMNINTKPIIKALAKTLFLFNSGIHYGPSPCQL